MPMTDFESPQLWLNRDEVKGAMVRLGITSMGQLCDVCGLSRATVMRALRPGAHVTGRTVAALSLGLGVPPYVLARAAIRTNEGVA